MILDQLIGKVLGITPRQRFALIGEKPIGAKLEILASHFEEIKDIRQRALVKAFCDLASETKAHRNRCFHGVWGFRTMSRKKVVAAASHFKAGNDPVRATQLPALERKLCKTSRAGLQALSCYIPFKHSEFCNRLFHGASEKHPEWLQEWIEQHPADDRSLDRRWKQGQLPYLEKPL
jgi:hypothetical protein